MFHVVYLTQVNSTVGTFSKDFLSRMSVLGGCKRPCALKPSKRRAGPGSKGISAGMMTEDTVPNEHGCDTHADLHKARGHGPVHDSWKRTKSFISTRPFFSLVWNLVVAQ